MMDALPLPVPPSLVQPSAGMLYTDPDESPRDSNGAIDAVAAKKRRRGANRLSCAECRRLKLRCDRGVPCSSCVKRGCAAICPEGSLTTGQGNRFVLASTQELHEKIHELSLRVRSLEDGLRQSHARQSSDPHPLLTDDLLKVKMPLQRDIPNVRNGDQPAQGSDDEDGGTVVDAVGSLSITQSGLTKYFGNSSNSWYFLQNENPHQTDLNERVEALRTLLPPHILALTGTFPVPPTVQAGPEPPAARLANLFWYLPSADKAAEMRDIYYSHGNWMYNPITPDQFNEEVFYQFYGLSTPTSSDEPVLAHRLSLMFMVLAIGTLMDPHQEPFNIEAEKYHQLARAALFQSNIIDDPTISGVQALYMMTYYFFLSDRHGEASGSRFAIMGLAIRLAQSIGLHRDYGRFDLPSQAQETLRRRALFWELYTYDLWQCFTIGRPPSFNLAHIDCKPPHAAGDVPIGDVFEQWKHKFTTDCMSVLLDQAFGARTPKYATVLQLDRKLRAFPVPPDLQIAGFGSSSSVGSAGGQTDSVALVLQRHCVLAIREMSLLYLHRSFFARAISDHPKDPLGSPYGSSVIAAYRSAGSLVALMRNLHSSLQVARERLWFLWGHVFSCAIILGSIVTRCPSMSLAPSALVQLDSACELFSRTAGLFRAESVLQIMIKLRERAHASLASFRDGKAMPPPLPSTDPSSPHGEEDELFTLGGKTRLVTGKDASLSPTLSLQERSPTSHNPIVPLPLSPTGDGRQLHPNLTEYLRGFSGVQTFDDDMSPQTPQAHGAHGQTHYDSSSYGLQPLQLPSPHEVASYHASAPLTNTLAPLAQHAHASTSASGSGFPQYFPVFDYTSNVAEFPEMHHIMEGRKNSRTPENMQATWQDFVTQLQM